MNMMKVIFEKLKLALSASYSLLLSILGFVGVLWLYDKLSPSNYPAARQRAEEEWARIAEEQRRIADEIRKLEEQRRVINSQLTDEQKRAEEIRNAHENDSTDYSDPAVIDSILHRHGI